MSARATRAAQERGRKKNSNTKIGERDFPDFGKGTLSGGGMVAEGRAWSKSRRYSSGNEILSKTHRRPCRGTGSPPPRALRGEGGIPSRARESRYGRGLNKAPLAPLCPPRSPLVRGARSLSLAEAEESISMRVTSLGKNGLRCSPPVRRMGWSGMLEGGAESFGVWSTFVGKKNEKVGSGV